jgi:DNA invertase Pin-like site-specific DNA recombinase
MHRSDKPSGTRGSAYIRVSDGEKQDPQRQRETIARWADNRALRIDHFYEDVEGKNSRSRSERRVQFQALLAAVKEARWDWVVVDSQDRFGTKDAYEFGYFAHILRQHDCQLWSVSQGHLTGDDLATPIITSVNAGASKEELLVKGRRNVSGKRTKAAQGEWQGGYFPYAYDVVCLSPDSREKFRVVIEEMRPKEGVWKRIRIWPDGTEERFDGDGSFPVKEQQDRFMLAPSCCKERIVIAREIFQLYATGAWTLRSLCKRLNEQSINPIYGEGWYVTRLGPMLRNPVYYVGQTVWGKVSHGEYAQYVGGEYIVPQRIGGKPKTGRKNAVADWVYPKHTEAIITKALWDEVQTKLVGDDHRKRGLRNPKLWLAGLVYCGRCGVRMSGWTQDGACYYVCETFRKFGHTPANKTGCRLHRTKQDHIEKHVSRYVEEVAPQVNNLLKVAGSHLSGGFPDPSDIKTLHDELVDVTARMIEAVEGTKYEAKGTLVEAYRKWMEGQRPSLLAKIETKKAEIAELVERFAMLPKTARAALEAASAKVSVLQGELDTLEAEAEPLTERLEAIVGQVREFKESLNKAEGALAGDDLRRKAEALRRVVGKVVLQFRHYDHKTTDRRSKGGTIPKSTLEEVEVHPWLGEVKLLPGKQTIALDNTPGPS